MQVESSLSHFSSFPSNSTKRKVIPSESLSFRDNVLPSPAFVSLPAPPPPNSMLLLAFRKFPTRRLTFSETPVAWAINQEIDVIKDYCKISFTNYRVSAEI